MDIAALRREYTLAGLRRTDLDLDPLAQFRRWFDAAAAVTVADTSAVTVLEPSEIVHRSVYAPAVAKVTVADLAMFVPVAENVGAEPHAALRVVSRPRGRIRNSAFSSTRVIA